MSEAKPEPDVEFKSLPIRVGNYTMWDVGDDKIGISFLGTGEAGVFNKADFEAYVAAFFGLNF